MTGTRLMLRSHGRAITGLVVFAAVLGALQASGYATVAGSTATERITFARQSLALARQVSFLAPMPVDLGTFGGYVSWRVFGMLPLMLGLWAIWLAASMLRRHESRGWVEQLVAAGCRRRAVVGQAVGAFAVADLAVVAALCAGLGLTAVAQLSLTALTAQGVLLWCVVWFAFGLGAVAAQVASSVWTAFATGAIVVTVINLVNTLGGTVPALTKARQLSPFAWYFSSQPLTPGGRFALAPCLGLVTLGACGMLVAAAMFDRRDVGQAMLAGRDAGRTVKSLEGYRWYRMPMLSQLYQRRAFLAGWLVGMLALVVLFTQIAPSLVSSLQDIAALQTYLHAISQGSIERAVIGLFLLGTMQLVLALFAVAHVTRWAREDQDGHLELTLSTPISRGAVMLWRALSLTAAAAGLIGISMLSLAILAGRRGIVIGAGAGLRTTALLVLFTLAFAAAGAVVVAWSPRIAVFTLTAFAVVSYFVQEVAPLYGWPGWVLDLSVFHLIGNPLVAPPDKLRVAALAAVTCAGFALAWTLALRRDVGS
jgi:ABC-2 type transport system permease protein